MPELPEVETTLRGISPAIQDKRIDKIVVRQAKLRWPIPDEIYKLEGHHVENIIRRGKYLLLNTSSAGSAIIHLGMSGSLGIVTTNKPAEKHDHMDFVFSHNTLLRYHDPRRFGAILWSQEPLNHRLLCKLGPEPLSEAFHTQHLYQQSRNKRIAIKQFIMNSHNVVGVGNIYASEALFMAGINPQIPAGIIPLSRYEKLTVAIKEVLENAIKQGGTTLRDFVNPDGKTGYFQVSLSVYGKAEQPCPKCSKTIQKITQAQRSTFYCAHCQT
jgi:formamidopyrimidine-DNA glycosylase